ncbi:hypothetical protein NL676_039301 [Syzygium grande]|nr:hypothetical protein NL676_039301 [Syzygium grande]
MEDSLGSDIEYEIVDDEEEHEELGGLAFEPEVVDPIPEQVDAKAPEPMDIDEHVQQDPEPETESEAMSSEEEPGGREFLPSPRVPIQIGNPRIGPSATNRS